jgi:selenoprotein W-related protein
MTGFKTRMRNLTLVPSRGGCFEVTADGELVYSKLKTGQFPDEAALVDRIAAKLR